MNTPCDHPSKCGNLPECASFWKSFKTNSKHFWIREYCEGGKQSLCARARLKAKGRIAPATLLPNGDHIRV